MSPMYKPADRAPTPIKVQNRLPMLLTARDDRP